MRYLILFALFALSTTTVTAQSDTTTIVLSFMTRNNMLWPQYKNNNAQLATLKNKLTNNRDNIKQGKLKVILNVTCASFDDRKANTEISRKRMVAVSQLLEKYKIASAQIETTLFITPLKGQTDVAFISIIAGQKNTTTQTFDKTNTTSVAAAPEKKNIVALMDTTPIIVYRISPLVSPSNFYQPPVAPKINTDTTDLKSQRTPIVVADTTKVSAGTRKNGLLQTKILNILQPPLFYIVNKIIPIDTTKVTQLKTKAVIKLKATH